MIKGQYLLNQHTLALLPAKAIDHDTIALEINVAVKVRQKALKIIDHTCLALAWTTYEGRVKAVRVHTGFHHKIAIPITSELLFFPTASIHHMENVWVNFTQIKDTQKIDTHTSMVQFQSGQSIHLPVSYRVLTTQIERAYEIDYRMTQKLLSMSVSK